VADEVAGYLETLASGLRQRELLLESGNDSVSFSVADDVEFECAVRNDDEKGRRGIEIAIGWTEAHRTSVAATGFSVTSAPVSHDEYEEHTEGAGRKQPAAAVAAQAATSPASAEAGTEAKGSSSSGAARPRSHQPAARSRAKRTTTKRATRGRSARPADGRKAAASRA
jgi:amphi-Trp domain-containing protein